jgi:hypothetical protein
MKTMIHELWLIVLALSVSILSSTAAFAFTSSSEAAAEQEVLAAVQTFFDTMHNRDVEGARRVLMPEGRFHNVRFEDGGRVERTFTHQEHLNDLATDTTVFLERMWQPEVRVHKGIATVWTRYDIHVDGKFGHCGVDAFQLIETSEGWKISGGSYTVERSDCPESPLGPPEVP